jgi:hypothetical protein
MSISIDQLNDFHQFALARVGTGNVESLDELFDLWRLEHPTDEERTDVHEAIRTGLADLEAARFRSADVVTGELRAKHGL